MVEQGRYSIVGIKMPTQCAMHFLQQKEADSTTIRDH